MCTLVKKSQKLETLDKDLKVYKLMKRKAENGMIISGFKRFPYQKGKLYKTKIAEETSVFNMIPFDSEERNILRKYLMEVYNDPALYIGSGFHSALTIERLKSNLYYNNVIVECIIPKGSQILRGIDKNLIVSNQIIINEIVFNNSEN